MKTTTFLFGLILTAGIASAQPGAPATRTLRGDVEQPATRAVAPVDARFASWLGCWRLDDDLAGTGARMCITPEKEGVRLQTVVGANKGIDELVVPDGTTRPITDAECKGTERAEWSKDGARVFRSTDVTCGNEAPRTIKTVAFMAPGPSWINVQHVSGAAANASVRVQRYRRAANQKLADGSTAQQADSTTALRTTENQTHWSIEDVIEASTKAPAEAVQAALTEARHRFDLNRKTLVLLDEGNVDDSVIDLMVALTYPQRFVVERRGGGGAPAGITTGSGWFDPFMPGMTGLAMNDCYSPYGYGYRSYYSMCGSSLYGPLGYNTFGYGYNPRDYYYGGWVSVGAFPSVVGSAIPVEPQGEGRVVNGRGYTQIRNRESESTPRVGSGGNGGGWNGSGSGGATSGGYSSGSSSSGSSSGGGGSAGGDSGARVAVPKGGGGR